MELENGTQNVTPITTRSKVAEALQEIREENRRLRRENLQLHAQVEEIAAIAVRQALAIQDALARDASDAGA